VAFEFAWHHGLARVSPTTDTQTDTSCVLQCNQHEIANGATQLTGWTCFCVLWLHNWPSNFKKSQAGREDTTTRASVSTIESVFNIMHRNDGAFDGSRSSLSINKSERARARLHSAAPLYSGYCSVTPSKHPASHPRSQSKGTSQASNVQARRAPKCR
jgi:hypothetical protein